MLQKFILAVLFVFTAGLSLTVPAQTADVGIRPNFAGGEVTSVDNSKIVLQTKDGVIEVVLAGTTEYKRVPPENPTLKAAVASSLTDIGVGDKLLVTGTVSADKKNVPAKTVYLLSKSDIAQKLEKERQAWRTRGITGRVTKVDFQTGEVTIAERAVTGERTVVISPKDKAKYLRYAPNSVNYNEAKASNIKEIFIGDMVRALGDRNQEGTNFKAEIILSGAFQTVGGTIKSVDAAKNEVVIEDIRTKKDVTVVVGNSSQLKKFPEEMAQRMAQFQMMQASGVQPPQGARPPQQNQAQGQTPPTQPGQGGGGMRGDINDMFERLPVVTLADLKAGDMIAVSSTKTDDPSRVTAIRLLAGVEPFLKMPQMPGGRGNQGGVNSNFSIPGLDGIDIQ